MEEEPKQRLFDFRQSLGQRISQSVADGSANEFDALRSCVLGAVLARVQSPAIPDGRSYRARERPRLGAESGRCLVTASRCRASAKVRNTPHAQTLGDHPEAPPGRCEEAAQQTTLAQPLQPRLPLRRAGSQAVENLGHFARCVLFAPSGRNVRPWAPGSCYSGSRAGNGRWKRKGLSGSRATLVSLRPVLRPR